MHTLYNTWDKLANYPLVPFFLVAFFFFEPISSSAKSIFLALSLLCILLTPAYRAQLGELLSKPWCQLACLLFLFALLACLWSPATLSEKVLIVEKYSKFLYLPLLALGFQDKKTRHRAVHAFLFGMFLTCLLSLIIYMHVFPQLKLEADAIFRNHIMTSIMMSFASFLCAGYFLNKTRPRIFYALLYVLFSYQVLFINTGRTGYIVYFLLMILLVLQQFTQKQAAIALLLIGTTFALCYQFSPVMQSGFKQVRNDWHQYQQNKNTSIGYRLQFHDFARKLYQRHPIEGNGTASFSHLFLKEKPVPSWDRKLLEPHSQYWFIAVELGLIGMIIFFLFYASLFLATWPLTNRFIALGVLVSFAAANLTDSLLLYSGSGYFFVAFLALCLGESLGKVSSHRKENPLRA